MTEKRIALSEAILRVDTFINVLSGDIELIEKHEKLGKTCYEFYLEKKYKMYIMGKLVDMKKELIEQLSVEEQTKKVVESLGVVMTDDQWKEFQKQVAKIEEKMYDESHPMDD